ncbi:MAG: ribonuclease J [Alphaproteobacteria bacterium]
MTINFKQYDNDLLFLPLGGSNEIGMNLNLYRTKGKWLMIDCGIGFAEPHLPGVEIILPNIDAIAPFKQDLLACVLTHAHEDHLGALPYLWTELGCPVYATGFTAAVLKAKFAEEGLGGKVKIHEVKAGEQYQIGPFGFEMVPITHSIPEMHAVALRTDKGIVMHTGDWKLDANPLVGVTTDEETLKRYGDEGVLAMVCDSTNVFVEGESGSEEEVRESLTKIIGRCKERAIITTFSSNVARLETVIKAALAAAGARWRSPGNRSGAWWGRRRGRATSPTCRNSSPTSRVCACRATRSRSSAPAARARSRRRWRASRAASIRVSASTPATRSFFPRA